MNRWVCACLVALLCSGASISFAQNGSSKGLSIPNALDPTRAELEKKKAAWQKFLSAISKSKKISILFDIDLKKTPPFVSIDDKKKDASLLRTLAYSSGTEWKQIKNIQTFTRRNKGLIEDINECVKWLNSVSESDKEALFADGIDYRTIDPKVQNTLMRLASVDGAMPFAISDNKEKVSIGLRFAPQVSFVDPKNNQRKTINILPDSELKGKPPTRELPVADASVEKIEVLQSSEEDELDFGTGSLADLKSILEVVGEIFDVTYKVDDRISSNLYFISGRFSKEKFEEAIVSVSTVPGVELRSGIDQKNVAALMESLDGILKNQEVDVSGFQDRFGLGDNGKGRSNAPEKLDVNSFLANKTVMAGSLMDKNPGLAQFLKSRGVDASMQIELRSGLSLGILCSGFHFLEGGSGAINGQAVGAAAANKTVIRLK